MSDIFPAVYEYQDGVSSPVEADYLNRPVRQLRQRTDYLYDKIQQLAGLNPFEAVLLQSVQVAAVTPPVPGDVVYLDPVSKSYKKAEATPEVFPIYPWESADAAAFAIGVLLPGNTVAAYGKTVVTIASGFTLPSMVQSDETYRNGPYYLSSSEPGKLTASPKDISVYIGHLIKNDGNDYGYILLMPQMKDLWEAHRHRSFVLAAQAAGVVETVQADEYVPDPDTDIHYIRGLLSDAPANAYMRLYVVGDWAGDGEVTYTIKVTPDAGTGLTAIVSWTTDDGSDDSTALTEQQIGYYEREVPIGTKGLKVIIERVGNFSDYDDPSMNFLTFGTAVATWTVVVPTAVKGWLGHRVRATAVRTVGDCECRIVAMGQLSNSDAVNNCSWEVEVTSAGTFGAGDVELTITGTGLAAPYVISGVGLSQDGVLPVIDLSHVDRDLKFWLLVTDRSEDGTLAPDTDVDLGDKWTISFVDNAPDFKYVYSVGMDAGLATYYPPVPFDNMLLEMNGVTMDQYGKFVAGEGSYVATPYSLYWLDDHYGAAPFPPEGPVIEELERTLELYFVQRKIDASGIVTSLRPDSGSVVSFVDCATGQPATVGDLKARVQLSLSYADSNVAGYNAVKSIDANGKLRTGPLVEKLLAGNNVTLEQVAGPAGYGTIRINADTGTTVGEFDDMRLNNAKQEAISATSLFSYTKLLPWTSGGAANVKSGFTAQMIVPYTLTGNYKLLFYVTAFGLATVAASVSKPITGLRLTWNVMKDYLDGNIGENFISDVFSDTLDQNLVLGVPDPGTLQWDYTAYDPFLVHNDPSLTPNPGVILDPFGAPIQYDDEPLTSGDMVAIRLERIDNVADAAVVDYPAALGFMRIRWRLISA